MNITGIFERHMQNMAILQSYDNNAKSPIQLVTESGFYDSCKKKLML